MKKTMSRIILCLSMVGLILPHGTPAAAANLNGIVPAAAATPVVDVALTDGLLRGQLLDRQGLPKSQVPVTVSSGDRVVQRTTSDEQGRFAVQLSQGGIYSVSAGDSSTVVRAWTQTAAPPSAKDSILLVSGQNVARGHLGNNDGFFSSQVCRTAIAIAAIGGIATAIVLAVSDSGS